MKRRNEHPIQQLCRVCFIVLLVAACLYFVIWQVVEPPIDLDQTDAAVLEGLVYTASDGSDQAVEPEHRYPFDADGVFEVRGVLPAGIRDESLVFLSWYDTEVLVGGREIYRYSMTEDVRFPGGAVKSISHFVKLDESCAGQELVIRQHRAGEETCQVEEVYIGLVSDVYRVMFKKHGATFIMGLMLLVLALIVMVFGFAIQYRMKQAAGIVSISVAIAMSAGWIVTDSYFYPYIFGHFHIDGLMSYLLSMLLPIPYIMYVSFLQKGRHHRVYTVMQIITLVFFCVCTGLHFSGLVKFNDLILAIDVLLVGSMAVGGWFLLKELREGYIHAYRYTAIGMCGFMVFCLAEIVTILLPNRVNTGTYGLIGLMWLLTFAVAQQVEDSRVVDLERRQALEISRTKSAFLASMSHEIRTPINSILGMNEMILRESKDQDIRNYAGTIQRSGRMLLSLINDVLDYSRIEAGKLEIVEEDYRLSELILDITAVAKERAEQKGLDCAVTIGEKIPDGMKSDEVRIKQILLNLVSNAVKYTDEGGIGIAVGGEYLDGETFNLRFDVKDTGRGIRKEDQEHLFEAFSRSDMKKNRNIEGTGLGLAIVKSIADSMGGTVDLESEYQKGSVFTVTLPQKVTDRTPVPEKLQEMPVQEKRKERRMFTAPEARILAVDDNRPNLSIVSAFLKETKAQVDLCTNGNDAIAKCRENRYDVMLLDHMMPEPDGIETLEKIRSDPESKNRETPAVVLTANAMSGSKQMYLKAGFADYLPKPLEADELEETVRRFLPAEKVKDASDAAAEEEGVLEFEAADTEIAGETKIPEGLKRIPGLNLETALTHTAGSTELLKEILEDICGNAPAAAKELRQSLEKQDYEQYRITAHSLKGLMATIGAEEMSAAAKRHEYAARNGEYAFIEEHCGPFAKQYEDFCADVLKTIREE